MKLTLNQRFWQLTIVGGILFFLGMAVEEAILSPLIQYADSFACLSTCIIIPSETFALVPIAILLAMNVPLAIQWRRLHDRPNSGVRTMPGS